MKIAFTGNTFARAYPEGLITGYNVAAESLLEAFMRHGKADELLYLYEPGKYQENVIRRFAEERTVLSTGKKIELINEYDVLFHGVDQLKNVDILHSIKEDVIPLLSMREKIGKPIPITFTFHSLAEPHLIWDTFIPMLMLPFKPYDAMICTSNAVVHFMEKMFERIQKTFRENSLMLGMPKLRLEKVNLGVDTDYFCPMEKNSLREKYGIPQDAFIILWFGRFSDCFKADLFPLLHVFHKLTGSFPDKKIMLILAGSQERGTNYAGTLKEQITYMGLENRVHIVFNGQIKDRAELYNIADVFTSPADNIQETFGLTPIEAMSCGIPQIVSDWDGYRDTVKHGVTGFRIHTAWCDCLDDISATDYLPANIGSRRLLHAKLAAHSVAVDCSDFLEKLKLLVSDNDLIRKMSVNSRKRAKQCFDIRHTVEHTESVWDDSIRIAHSDRSGFNPEGIPTIDYCHDFSGYPSEMLDDSTLFEPTVFCSCENYVKTPCCNNGRLEESEIPVKIIGYIKKAGTASIKQIIVDFENYSPDQIKRTLMLLYKYDFIKISTGFSV